MKKGRGYYCYIILPKGSGKPTKKIISNSSTPIEIYNKYIYNVDVETDRLLPASAKCARFLITDNKNVISKSIKHIFIQKIRHKYRHIFLIRIPLRK